MARTPRILLSALALSLIALAGCHYKVTDPASGKVFYTTSVDKVKRGGGAIKFKDARTDAEITLQSSEVQSISGKEFDEAVGKK